MTDAPSPKYNGQAISQDSAERKTMPLATGFLDYFPAALMEGARHSFLGNAKHNGAGTPLHWARGKSMDHADCIARHLIERGGGEWIEIDGERHWMRHSAALLWRAAAMLQEEMEAEGAAPGRASVFPPPVQPKLHTVVLTNLKDKDKRIASIKALREVDPGLSLKDAKDIVDNVYDGVCYQIQSTSDVDLQTFLGPLEPYFTFTVK